MTPMARDENSLLRFDPATHRFVGFSFYRPDAPAGGVRLVARDADLVGITLTQDDVRALIQLLADAAAEAQLAAEDPA